MKLNKYKNVLPTLSPSHLSLFLFFTFFLLSLTPLCLLSIFYLFTKEDSTLRLLFDISKLPASLSCAVWGAYVNSGHLAV